MSAIAEQVQRLEAQLGHGAVPEVIMASVGYEMWYVGTLLYQPCTTDGQTLWKANQADNISAEEMHDLAYRWVRIHPQPGPFPRTGLDL